VAQLRTGISERARDAIRRSIASASTLVDAPLGGGRLQATAARLLAHGRPGLTPGGTAEPVIRSVLQIARRELAMDVAFLSEFRGGRRIFVAVDDGLSLGFAPGDSEALETTYCQRVVDGRLPPVVRDASLEPSVRELPVTQRLGIRAHISAPVTVGDDVYGTFCCFSTTPRHDLGDGHLSLMNVLGAVVGAELERDAKLAQRVERRTDELRRAVVQAMSMVFQPIVDLASGDAVGFEALARFDVEPYRPPNEWFDEATRVGIGTAVELRAINLAVAALDALPRRAYLSVNASARAIESGLVRRRLERLPCDRLVVEITEYEPSADDARLVAEVASIRELGARIGVDDTGVGYSGLSRLVQLRPDLIKLDRTLITGLAADPARQAVAAALAQFAATTGAKAVAEGIETEDDLEFVQRSGIVFGQGYLLGHPSPLATGD
jgi:EAL domain-containing protein (putative c-di-GMP-specific phosphodiesterase class I)